MKYLSTLLLLCFAMTVSAQAKYDIKKPFTDEKLAVFETVVKLFDGMRAGDSSMVHSVFRDNPDIFTSSNNAEGKLMLHRGELQKFLTAVGTPHDVIYDEPIWDVKIEIDGNLAMVWSPYAFYAGKNFSHCGVDAFLLNKDEEGWKIFHLTDTRQKTGCNVPESIKKGRDK
ncbi:hypothetical protein [Fulvivirga lutimaris]|uniref:hypothetical protein n=1 Tax=Fulvivirga lutimaris TaxID=1819566 RepID=UPI0012BD00A2|nr:hypothetical protein [Fulvivirga lutimaris]MTI40179.1 hypothetical protein [Fulvivirga lutimaris]